MNFDTTESAFKSLKVGFLDPVGRIDGFWRKGSDQSLNSCTHAAPCTEIQGLGKFAQSFRQATLLVVGQRLAENLS